VRLRHVVADDCVLAEVQDEGPGFRPADAPDPFAEENRERDGGRGLFLMRHYMSWVRYNPAGNCVLMCKRRGEE
jgi:serine/threonine-protein kinase RsbW